MCKLAYKEWRDKDEYILHVDDVLATELPKATPIKKQNLPEVCRSEITEFLGESKTRKSWLLFLRGVANVFAIEHDKRTQMCSLWVAGKLVAQWHCIDPYECPSFPYLLVRDGIKF